MRVRERILAAALVAAVAAFALGLGRLFDLRFQVGDVYPPYSSLRADPLGAKVLHDSLADLPGLSVDRNYRPLIRLSAGAGEALLVLGLRPGALRFVDQPEAEALERFVEGGGRLVIALRPDERPPAPTSRPTTTATSSRGDGDGGRGGGPPVVDLARRWGFGWTAMGGAKADPTDRRARLAPGRTSPPLAGDEGPSWHASVCLDDLDSPWRTVLVFRGRPAVVERSMGRGTIVLAADSFFISNEALRTDRCAALLTWLVGRSGRVVFDETHLGVRAEAGIVALGRRYGLHGSLAAVLVLAALFIWRSAGSLVPRRQAAGASRADWIAGRESGEGLVNLLRRATRPADLLRVCLEQWQRGIPPQRRDRTAKAQRMSRIVERQAALPARKQDPVGAYKAMAKIVAERN